MEEIRCFERTPIQCAAFKKISKVRYFHPSSIYLVLAVGILELVARLKNHYFTKNPGIPKLIPKTFTNFFKEKDQSNRVHYFASHIIEKLESSSEAFKVLNSNLSDTAYLLDIEEACRDIICQMFDEEDINKIILQGEDPILYNCELFLQTISNNIGLYIKLYKVNDDVNLGNELKAEKFKPEYSGYCPKLILLINDGSYALGYSEIMNLADEEGILEERDLKKVLKENNIKKQFSSLVRELENKNNSQQEEILNLERCIENIVGILSASLLYDPIITQSLESIQFKSKNEIISKYLANSRNSNIKCALCNAYYPKDKYFNRNCSNCQKKICKDCLTKSLKNCLYCSYPYTSEFIKQISGLSFINLK